MSFFLVAGSLFSFLLLIALAGVVLGTPLFLIGATLLERFAPERKSKTIQFEDDDQISEKSLHSVRSHQFNVRVDPKPTLFPSRAAK